MKTFMFGAAALLATVATPSLAATYDLAGDFGGSVFSYGTVAGDGTFTAFGTSDCSDISVSTLCYRGNDKFQVVFQKDATQILAHPGPASTTAVLFTAPTSSVYTFNVNAEVGDSGTTGVNLSGTFSGSAPFFLYQLSNATPTFGVAGLSLFLNAGQSIGLVLDNNGSYFNDSTLLSGSIAAVPEPATWAMMIGGMGLVGGSLRRRAKKVTFAAA